MRKYLLLVSTAILLIACSKKTSSPPSLIPENLEVEWRIPTQADMTGDWKTYQKEDPEPYHVTADFDGNGSVDDGWILLKKNNEGWSVFFILRDKNSDRRSFEIYKEQKRQAQGFDLSIVSPGTYQSACAKGLGPQCRPNDAKSITLKNPAIRFGQSESGGSIYYWDEKTQNFQEFWDSD